MYLKIHIYGYCASAEIVLILHLKKREKSVFMTLQELEIGKSAIILAVDGEQSLRQHFLDMGLIPGVKVTMVKYAPMGDPLQILLYSYELTLRRADAERIEISFYEEKEAEATDLDKNSYEMFEHPGLGESTPVYHDSHQKGLPKNQKIAIALVGNQNSGKTTLFNQLTGLNQHVGNYPGVTVDAKSCYVKGHPNIEVVDLPGIYSLSPYSREEMVTREYILDMKPTAIINIVDATNIERNLYLTMQLMELNIPIVVALNMMDELRSNGGTVYINIMENMLGIPVVPISALKNEGTDELIEHAEHIARYHECPARQDFCKPTDHNGVLHRSIHGVMHLIEDHALRADIPIRFAASKLIEDDIHIKKALQLNHREEETVSLIVKELEEERGLDPSAAIADMRFSFIMDVCRKAVQKPLHSKEHVRSIMMDKILTGKWTAIPAFLSIMIFIFWITFDVVGGNLQLWLSKGIRMLVGWTDQLLTEWNTDKAVHSLIVDGIFSGLGAVLSFVPIIVILFLFLSLLEDSGYMARIAFVMDKPLRRLGLSGRSIVPMLMGFGCSVPSIMACRTLPSERDRRLTVMLIPFMSCTAKLPVYAFFTAMFFPQHGAKIMVCLYMLGMFVGVMFALLVKRFIFKGQPVPFVMELPNYRIPGFKSVIRLMWDKVKEFVQRAFTVIFLASIVVWFLQTFDFRCQIVEDSKDSMLALLAGWISPVFSPLGFDDWRIVTSLVSGFLAKETIVSTLTVLFGTTVSFVSFMSSAVVMSLLVFCLLYTPCVATIATVRHEMGGRYAVVLVLWQCLIAWICAFVVYHVYLFIF